MPVSANELDAYHARPGAFERLAPPWHSIRVVERSGSMRDGGRLTFAIGWPVKRRWTAEMTDHAVGRQFIDRQVEGPFAQWEHTHRFVAMDDHTSELIDHVEYRLPAGELTGAFGEGAVRKFLRGLFRFRHERTRSDLERHAEWAQWPRLKVVVAGAGGLVGSQLTAYLTTGGHEVVRLVRRPPTTADEVRWDPAAGDLDPGALAGTDAVISLSGENLAGLWTARRRQAIVASRVHATGTLARALAGLGDEAPGAFVSVSAVGAYGSRGDEIITEESPRGEDFLADVCAAWEGAADPAAEAGVRVVHPRLGLVLTPRGGALAPLLPLFKAGLGSRIGDGSQWWSWVAIDDVLGALDWLMHHGELSGAVNVTSPEPVTNREFTATLAGVLHRPAALAAPRVAVETVAGDMGRQMLLASQRALPARLEGQGFRFDYPALAEALRFLLGKE